MFYVFDLDGTLADITHRTHHVRNGARNWKQFFAECDKDIPVQSLCMLADELHAQGHRVEIWSGRSDEVREKTVAWLTDVAGMLIQDRFPSGIKLTMRPAADMRPDEILKKEWLDKCDARPDVIFDDRQKVVDMWRAAGVTCAQVAPGDFDDPKPKQIRGRGIPTLYMMIGPSGAGKSHKVKNLQGQPLAIVSTDEIRRVLFGTQNGKIDAAAYTPEGFSKTFAAAHNLVAAHIMNGQSVVYDATNLNAKDRKAVLKAAGLTTGKAVANVEYHVVDRPLDEKLASFKNAIYVDHTSEDIIRAHDAKFKSAVTDIMSGDGFKFVKVYDHRGS